MFDFDFITGVLIRTSTKRTGEKLLKQLISEGENLDLSQEKLLLRILERQKNTEFGKKYGFSTIKSVLEFQKAIPIFTYEDLRPWIEKQEESKEKSINSQQPILYAQTSGTTGMPKWIPILPRTIKNFKFIQKLFAYGLYKDCPEVFSGSILGIVSPAVEGHLPSGTPYGSTSGFVYQKMPKIAQRKYVLPPCVFQIQDYELKYQTIVRFALAHDRITYIGTANPSTIVKLVQVLNDDPERWISDVETGRFFRWKDLPVEVRSHLKSQLSPLSERAKTMRSALLTEGKIRLKHLWPDLKAIGCWTGGSSEIFIHKLRKEIPESTVIRELGYLASEFRGTIPIESGTSAGIPTFQYNFLEFVERKEWDNGEVNFKTLGQIQDNEQYYIFVTNDSGLYRYNMNDIVEVEGFFHGIPRIKFVQKGKGVTNITGEKLYENQIIDSVHRAEKKLNIQSVFFMALADEANSRYNLYYENFEGFSNDQKILFENEVEKSLQTINLEYETKRKSGRLKPVQVYHLKDGTYEKYKMFKVSKGQREGQFKIMALQYFKDEAFPFEKFVMGQDPISWHIQSLNVPMQVTFRHSSAARSETDSLVVSFGQGFSTIPTSWGESCPRSYVTGETVEGAMAWLHAKKISSLSPSASVSFLTQHEDWKRSLDELRFWVQTNREDLDRNPAAWCALELALLDHWSKVRGGPVETLLGISSLKNKYNYTAVLSNDDWSVFQGVSQKYIQFGFSDYKIKASGDVENDSKKIAFILENLPKTLLPAFRVRLDANNLWTQPQAALEYLIPLQKQFEKYLFAIEEPLASKDKRN